MITCRLRRWFAVVAMIAGGSWYATSNASALALFAWQGHVWWHLTLMLAVANVVGSLLGTRMALKHGTGFVRGVFLVVVSALILKTAWTAFG